MKKGKQIFEEVRVGLVCRPVAVLSNNDGCCVSRSNEFKALGIPMGTTYFQLKNREASGELCFCSSNYVRAERILTAQGRAGRHGPLHRRRDAPAHGDGAARHPLLRRERLRRCTRHGFLLALVRNPGHDA